MAKANVVNVNVGVLGHVDSGKTSVVGGPRRGHRYTFTELLKVSPDVQLQARYESLSQLTTLGQGVGAALLAGGIAAGVATGVRYDATAYTSGAGSNGPPAALGVLLSVVTSVVGAGVLARSTHARRDLRYDDDLEEVMGRSEAWRAISGYNSALLDELILDDSVEFEDEEAQ